MRRAADLYPGESKTDRRDAFVLADTGRTRRHQVHWLDAGGDELLEQLRILNGYDTDLAADATRASLRSRRRFRVLTEPAYVQLRKWISEFDWERWNSQIEADSEAGRLEFLIAEAREAGERGALDEL